MSLLHPGQRTPSGQRSWRTSAKHLASSSSPERLTKSDEGMIEGSLHEGGNRSAAPIIRSEVPRDRYPLPPLNTPEANKSLLRNPAAPLRPVPGLRPLSLGDHPARER